MTIKKILFTYDFTEEAYQEFMKRQPSMFLKFTDQSLRNQYSEKLADKLRKRGMEVEMLTHKEGANIDKTVADLEAKVKAADMVFHDTTRIAFQFDESPWKKEYQEAIQKSISASARRGEIRTRNHDPSSKMEATRIVMGLGIPIPREWQKDEYFSSKRHLPVLLKRDGSTGGEGIFFIDKHEQMDRFWNVDLYEKVGNISLMSPSEEEYTIQEFIRSPSDHFTHYRILTLGDGQIIGSVMGVSANTENDSEIIAQPGPFGWGKHIYHCVDSPVYLGCRPVISNSRAGGSQIALDPNKDSKPRTRLDKKILKEHNIDPEHPTLDQELKSLAAEVAKGFSKHKLMILGQDWIQDRKGNFYFIEVNAGPGLEMFNTLYNRGEGNDESAVDIGTRMIADALSRYGG